MSIIGCMRPCTNLRLGFTVLALIIADGDDANKNWGEQWADECGEDLPSPQLVEYGMVGVKL